MNLIHSQFKIKSPSHNGGQFYCRCVRNCFRDLSSYKRCETHVKYIHFFQPTPILFALQKGNVYGQMRIVHEGTSISESVHAPDGYGATITGTAMEAMEEGQRVSGSLVFMECN